jgi:hypothetical protein
MHAGLANQPFLPSQVQKIADSESVVVIAKLRAAEFSSVQQSAGQYGGTLSLMVVVYIDSWL